MHHLTVLDLDAVRAGEPLSAAAHAHLARCADCQGQLADLVALAEALRTPVRVPAEREAAILAAAHRRADLARRPGGPRRVAWALAASLLLALGGVLLWQRHRTDPPGAGAVAARSAASRELGTRDRDGDGRVTVLDAFALARAAVRRTPGVDRADAREVDAVLAMAVSLSGTN